MFANFFTTLDELDAVLSDGIPMSDKSTGVARKPNPTWLTKHSNLSAPSSEDQEFIASLQSHLNRCPPIYAVSETDANFEGAIRARVRIRLEQATWWLAGAIDDFETKRSNDFAIYNFDDGWRVLRQAITPNQIISVCRWAAPTGDWVKLELTRRLVRPASVRPVSRLKSRIAPRFRGDHHPVA